MLHVPSMEELGWRPLATAQRAEPNPSSETGTVARKADLFFASDNWFKAVAGRPLKNVAEDAKQGSRCTEETASKPDLPLAAAGRTAQPRGDAKQCFVITECFIRMRLTFDMRGVQQQAKLDVARPLDGRVRPMAVGDGPACRAEPELGNGNCRTEGRLVLRERQLVQGRRRAAPEERCGRRRAR